MANNPIFTVGHSNHSLENFLTLLWRHRISAVADVRSALYSRVTPHFNRQAISSTLRSRDACYVYLGRELGGRPEDPTCYADGCIRYERVVKTSDFREGIERVVDEATRHRLALMCTEKEPLDCHRTLLIAQALDDDGVNVAHILAGGEVERHFKVMDRLMAKFDLNPDGDMFQPRNEFVAKAISLQAQRVAFVKNSSALEAAR